MRGEEGRGRGGRGRGGEGGEGGGGGEGEGREGERRRWGSPIVHPNSIPSHASLQQGTSMYQTSCIG